MTISSKTRTEKAAKLRLAHLDILQSSDKFIPKCAYTYGKDKKTDDPGKLVMGFFHHELEGGVNIYTETVDFNWDPEQISNKSLIKGQLYMWPFNPEWEISYPTKDNGQILIPVSELKLVEKPKKTISSYVLSTEVDAPISQLTIRDLYAMLTDSPISTKQWLNEAINKRNESK